MKKTDYDCFRIFHHDDTRNVFRILRRSPLLSDRLPSGKQLRIHRHQRRFRDPDAGRLRDLQQKCHRSLYAVGKRIP